MARPWASGSVDISTIILWDVANRQPLGQPLTGRPPAPWRAWPSVLMARPWPRAVDDHTIFLWDVSLESWQDRACRIANRNLTRAEWKQYIGDIEPYRATCSGLPLEEEAAPEAQAKTKTKEE